MQKKKRKWHRLLAGLLSVALISGSFGTTVGAAVVPNRLALLRSIPSVIARIVHRQDSAMGDAPAAPPPDSGATTAQSTTGEGASVQAPPAAETNMPSTVDEGSSSGAVPDADSNQVAPGENEILNPPAGVEPSPDGNSDDRTDQPLDSDDGAPDRTEETVGEGAAGESQHSDLPSAVPTADHDGQHATDADSIVHENETVSIPDGMSSGTVTDIAGTTIDPALTATIAAAIDQGDSVKEEDTSETGVGTPSERPASGSGPNTGIEQPVSAGNTTAAKEPVHPNENLTLAEAAAALGFEMQDGNYVKDGLVLSMDSDGHFFAKAPDQQKQPGAWEDAWHAGTENDGRLPAVRPEDVLAVMVDMDSANADEAAISELQAAAKTLRETLWTQASSIPIYVLTTEHDSTKDRLWALYEALHAGQSGAVGSEDNPEEQSTGAETPSGSQNAADVSQPLIGAASARGQERVLQIAFEVMFDVMEAHETFALDRHGNPVGTASRDADAAENNETASSDGEGSGNNGATGSTSRPRIVGYTLPEAGTPVADEHLSQWAEQMPTEPVPTDELEAWPPQPHEGAKRVNGTFTFESRGHAIDLEDARESLERWAKTTFGDEADVQFESEFNETAARTTSGKPGIQGVAAQDLQRTTAKRTLKTGERAHVATTTGRTGSYTVVVRGDVTGSGTPGLTQLVHVAAATNEDKAANMTTEQRAAADINGDGKVSITDAAQQASYMTKPHEEGALHPAEPIHSAWETDNIGAHNYINSNRWAAPTTSYLYENSDGGVTRVEYVGDTIVVENYSKDLKIQTGRQIPVELDKWGGFFAGKEYNYVVFGQDNMDEDPKKEVIRIVQYTKDWTRSDSVSLYGANTQQPFLAGSLRCAEAGGYLYVHTCHNMFVDKEEGINHQANMMIEIDQKNMKITNEETGVVWGTGLVSHSFNQFVLVDKDGNLVILDHGDANTRSLALRRYLQPAGQDTFIVGDGQTMEVEAANVQKIIGSIGDNDTGCTLGGFAETEKGYVSAYGYDGKGERNAPRDIYVSFTSRDLSKTTTTRLTKNVDAQAPMIASMGLDGGYILWEGPKDEMSDASLNVVRYTADGRAGTKRTADAHLSDCEPIAHDGKLLWYVTDKGAPVFYELTAAGVESVQEP